MLLLQLMFALQSICVSFKGPLKINDSKISFSIAESLLRNVILFCYFLIIGTVYYTAGHLITV